jgi:putative membrane protein
MRHINRFTPILALVLVASAAGAQAPKSTAPATPALDDATIVAIFDAANTYDIETGALAARKGSTQAVRDYGKQLTGDHTTVRQQGRDLAAHLHVTPTPPKDFALAAAHADAIKRLSALEGKAFDRAFLEHEVAFHKAVIDAVTTTLLPSLQNQHVKDLVTKVAPAFEAHRMAAQRLLDTQK